MDRRLVTTLSLALTLGTVAPTLAQDATPRLACPQCATVAQDGNATANPGACPDDGSPLVRSDLVALHAILLREARRAPFKLGLENPVAALVKDGTVDVAGLVHLVADYKGMLARVQPKAVVLAEATGALGSLRRIEAAEHARRRAGQGPGTLDDLGRQAIVASAEAEGYVVSCEATKDGTGWFSTASPKDANGTGYHLFLNDEGTVYYARDPFVVDVQTGAVPPGLERLSIRYARACPICSSGCEDASATTCPDDGAPLVRSDLLALHSIVLATARGPGKLYGLENPAARCVQGNVVDGAALERLVADYAALVANVKIAPIDLELGLSEPESAAWGNLMTIATSECIFQGHEKTFATLSELGGKRHYIDHVLAGGRKSGYRFVCEPSTDGSKWFATATPEQPGTGDYLFDNQEGTIFYSRKPFVVDKDTCAVPKGLTPRGR